jgi:plastocyanin
MPAILRIAYRLSPLLLVLAASPASPAASGAVVGRIATTGGEPREGVVVYVEGVPGASSRADRVLRIRQKDKAFTPSTSVVLTGTTVEFPNDDRIFHNVFSVSQAARFDLGLYKSGVSKSVVFKRPGVVEIYCNIHPEMVAKVKVLDTPFYAVTGKDGTFRIGAVPPGEYAVKAWQPWGTEWSGQVKVDASGTARLTVALDPGKPDKRHLRKDGSPYGRYR